MIRLSSCLLMFLLPACTWGGFGTNQPFQFQAGQGQYVRPDYMNPAPTPRVPPVDACRSQLYVGLVGRHEGSIYIAGLPGRKRIIKPAFEEGFEYQYDDPLGRDPTFIEVRDYIPDQVLYAPSIRTVSDLLQLGPEQNDRLTIELDADGFVQQIRCQ